MTLNNRTRNNQTKQIEQTEAELDTNQCKSIQLARKQENSDE
jgi:hypothetical protein